MPAKVGLRATAARSPPLFIPEVGVGPPLSQDDDAMPLRIIWLVRATNQQADFLPDRSKIDESAPRSRNSTGRGRHYQEIRRPVSLDHRGCTGSVKLRTHGPSGNEPVPPNRPRHTRPASLSVRHRDVPRSGGTRMRSTQVPSACFQAGF